MRNANQVLGIAVSLALCAGFCSRDACGGELYVLAIGVENYEKVGQIDPVRFADTDAQDFQTYVKTRWNLNAHITLLNGKLAKKHDIQNAFYTNLSRAGSADAVFLFISARGITDGQTNVPYILPYDALNENGAGTAIPLEYFSAVLRNRLQPAAQVYLFADLCRPDKYRPRNWIESSLKKMVSDNISIRGILATEPDKLSGDGVFGKALTGAIRRPDSDLQGKYDAFFDMVKQMAGKQQVPYKVPVRQPGRITWSRPPSGFRRYAGELAAAGLPFPLWLAMQADASADRLRDQFRQAVANEKLIGAGGALDLLQRLKTMEAPLQAEEDTAALMVALEDKAQQVIADYGSAEQFPNDPLRLDAPRFFEAGDYFDAAATLERQERKDEMRSRSSFCKGRAKLFDGSQRNVDGAADDLRRAIVLYPSFPEPYNAMGIVHLALAQSAGRAAPQTVAAELDLAIGQFQKATEIAPVWAYSRHNLALTYTEKGDLRRAEKEYKKAILLTPYHPYLQYNLGLLLQNQNRLREAEGQYKNAAQAFNTLIGKHTAALDLYTGRAASGGNDYRTQVVLEQKIIAAFKANLAETYNALGTIRENRRDAAGAEQYYKQALDNADSKEARHNLASLKTAESRRRGLSDTARLQLLQEAKSLWEQNLTTPPDHRPSLLGLARFYRDANQPLKAIPYYQCILTLDKGQIAAREELAVSLAAAGRDDEAVREFQETIRRQQEARSQKSADPTIYLALGDVYRRQKQVTEACQQYQAAEDARKKGFPAPRDLKVRLRECPAK